MLGTLLLTMALVAVADQPVPEAERLYARGVAAGTAFHLEEAEQSFREALATDSFHIPSKRALDVIDGLALELLSRESAVLIFEGLAAQDRKDWAAARERYAKATRASPGYGLAFHNLGVSLYEIGDTPAAIVSYGKALEWNPDYPYTHNNLGLAYARLGKYEEACKSYQTALELDPEYYKAYNNLGASLRQLGREDEAIAAFRQALDINPRYSVADGNLAHNDTLREAISPGPDAPAALTLVERLGSESYEERSDAMRKIADSEDSSAVPDLLLLLEDERSFVRRNSLHALAHLRDPRALGPALQLLRSDRDWAVRFDAVTVLAWLGDEQAVPALVGSLRGDEAAQVRRAAAWSLQSFQDCESARALVAALKDPVSEVRDAALMSLRESRADEGRLDGWVASVCRAGAPSEAR